MLWELRMLEQNVSCSNFQPGVVKNRIRLVRCRQITGAACSVYSEPQLSGLMQLPQWPWGF